MIRSSSQSEHVLFSILFSLFRLISLTARIINNLKSSTKIQLVLRKTDTIQTLSTKHVISLADGSKKELFQKCFVKGAILNEPCRNCYLFQTYAVTRAILNELCKTSHLE